MRRSCAVGFQSSKEWQLCNVHEFQKQTSKFYNIEVIFDRAKNMPTKPSEKKLSSQLGLKNKPIQRNLNNAQSLFTVCLPPVSQKEALKTLRVEVVEILNRLLSFVTERKKKYRCKLASQSSFYQRHLMVRHFLSI